MVLVISGVLSSGCEGTTTAPAGDYPSRWRARNCAARGSPLSRHLESRIQGYLLQHRTRQRLIGGTGGTDLDLHSRPASDSDVAVQRASLFLGLDYRPVRQPPRSAVVRGSIGLLRQGLPGADLGETRLPSPMSTISPTSSMRPGFRHGLGLARRVRGHRAAMTAGALQRVATRRTGPVSGLSGWAMPGLPAGGTGTRDTEHSIIDLH